MADRYLEEFLALSVPERLQLAQAIWDSIAEEPESLPISEAERGVLDRRLEAYRQDGSPGAPWSEVKANLLKRT